MCLIDRYKEDLIGVEVRTNDEYIQWKRKCDTNWTNLKPLSELVNYSKDKTVEVTVSSDYVRWKYSEDSSWNIVVTTTSSNSTTSLSTSLFTNQLDLKVENGYIQWKRFKSDSEYKNLKALTELENYTEDKTVSVRISNGFIEWKYSDGDYHQLQTVESLIGMQARFENGILQWKCVDETEWRIALKNGEPITADSLDTPIQYGPTAGGIE